MSLNEKGWSAQRKDQPESNHFCANAKLTRSRCDIENAFATACTSVVKKIFRSIYEATGCINMTSYLKNIAKMQIMLAEMEAEIGIRDIGAIEKSVLIAIVDLANDADLVQTKDILQHPLNDVYSRPSLFRALKKLESLGKIAKGGDKRGLYTLIGDSA